MTEHTHAFSDWPFPDDVHTPAFCTAPVAQGSLPVLQVAHDHDGDWQFLDAASDEPGKPVLLCLGCVFERDPTLAEIAGLPRGWGAWRAGVGEPWERWRKEPEANPRDEKALADIAAYGLHIINVMGEGDLPPFSYSIGIEKSLGQPELIVVGLPAELGQWMINECYRQMKEGAPVAPGARVSGLLEGFDCVIGAVSPVHFGEYMGWARWLYDGDGFRAHQIVFPTPPAYSLGKPAPARRSGTCSRCSPPAAATRSRRPPDHGPAATPVRAGTPPSP